MRSGFLLDNLQGQQEDNPAADGSHGQLCSDRKQFHQHDNRDRHHKELRAAGHIRETEPDAVLHIPGQGVFFREDTDQDRGAVRHRKRSDHDRACRIRRHVGIPWPDDYRGADGCPRNHRLALSRHSLTCPGRHPRKRGESGIRPHV